MNTPKILKKIKNTRLVRTSWLFIRCIYRFGFVLGIKIYSQINHSSSTLNDIKINLPGYLSPIILRSNTSDVEVFEAVFISQRFSLKLKNRSPKLIIDAGANIGLVSIFFAKKYFSAIIYAIEPEESNYQTLIENTIAYTNVKPIKAAIWKDNSPLSIENADAEKWAFRVNKRDNQQAHLIKSVTVDNILEISGCDFIDIFKIDIEGSEKELFEENYNSWINKVGLFIIELHEGLRGGCKRAFYDAINELKYSEYTKGQNKFVIADTINNFPS